MKIATSLQMKSIDNRAIEKYKIPSIVLMENAAIMTVFEIEKRYGNVFSKNIVVFCGKGNNGGDGFAIARHLKNKGANVCVVKVFENDNDLSKDAKINFDTLFDCNIVSATEYAKYLENAHIVVDAIFGTGIYGELSDYYIKVINDINSSKKSVVSVDIPSGINADNGDVLKCAIKADLTVTFSLLKRGHLLYPGAFFASDIKIVDISIPKEAIDEENIKIQTIEQADVIKNIPIKPQNANKTDFGKVQIIAGSVGMSGAAYLCSEACVTSGSGLVNCAVPNKIHDIMEAKLTEAMTTPLFDKDGIIAYDCISVILEKIKNCDALLFGCGIGRNDDIFKILSEIIKTSEIPIVIDADGLFALSKNVEILRKKRSDIVITPHTGEMARLINKPAQFVDNNKFEVANEFSVEYNVTVVLKGANTVIACPNGDIYVNQTGNNGLASGGTGDVLAGMIASFIGQGKSPNEASKIAVYIHGFCADLLAKKIAKQSIKASGIIKKLPKALKILSLEV